MLLDGRAGPGSDRAWGYYAHLTVCSDRVHAPRVHKGGAKTLWQTILLSGKRGLGGLDDGRPRGGPL